MKNFDRTWFGLFSSTKNIYWKVATTATAPSTAAVASILVTYKTFGTS
jgi:hypothetical protein